MTKREEQTISVFHSRILIDTLNTLLMQNNKSCYNGGSDEVFLYSG